MNGKGVALFGGSFNPIHMGHLIAARAVAEHLDIPRVILIPSANPPHKLGNTELADASDRLEMARRAVAGDPLFEVSDVEVRRHGPSYTILTVEHYREAMPDAGILYWIIGGDSLPDLASWYRIGELADLSRIVTAVRPGYESPDLGSLRAVLRANQIEQLRADILPTPRIDISATEIRRRVRTGKPVRYLVPQSVEEYIRMNAVYPAE